MKNKIHAKMKAKGVCIMSLEQKIDKFLEKKSKRSNFLIFLVVILCVGTMPLMFVDAFYGTGMDDAGTGITAIVSCIFFVFACCYMFKDYLVSMLVGTPQMARNNSTKKEDVIPLPHAFVSSAPYSYVRILKEDFVILDTIFTLALIYC